MPIVAHVVGCLIGGALFTLLIGMHLTPEEEDAEDVVVSEPVREPVDSR